MLNHNPTQENHVVKYDECDEIISRDNEENQIVLKEETVLTSNCMKCVEVQYDKLKIAKSYDEKLLKRYSISEFEKERDELIIQHDQEVERIKNELKKEGKISLKQEETDEKNKLLNLKFNMETRKELRRQELVSAKKMEKKMEEDEAEFKESIKLKKNIQSEKLNELNMNINDLIKFKAKYEARNEVIEQLEDLKKVIPQNTPLEHCIGENITPVPKVSQISITPSTKNFKLIYPTSLYKKDEIEKNINRITTSKKLIQNRKLNLIE
jgi:hypothetical protein